MDTKGKRKGQDELGDWDWHKYSTDTKDKTDDSWEPTKYHGKLYSMLCGDLDGKEIHMRDSHTDGWFNSLSGRS